MARILGADDDPDIRELVEFKLTSEGHDVVVVPDGATAVSTCRTQRPDLVVLDVVMPRMTGLDVLATLRAEETLPYVPVLLLTARARASDRADGLGSGADAYMTKPFSPRELAATVAGLLTRD